MHLFLADFSPIAVLIFYVLSGAVVLKAQNHFRGHGIGILICLFFLIASSFFMNSPLEWVLFLGSSLVFGAIDAMYVYVKNWSYNSTTGYCVWVGLGWGFVSIVAHQFLGGEWWMLAGLLLTALTLISAHPKKIFPQDRVDLASIFVLSLVGLLNPYLFLISFSLGIITEICAVEVFQTWKYRQVSYIQIGLGYGLLLTITELVYGMILGEATFRQMGVILGVVVLLAIKDGYQARKTFSLAVAQTPKKLKN